MKSYLFAAVSLALIFLYFKNIRQHVKPKNVVIIMADDLGFNDVSYRGSNEFQTPNIDALAYHGIILDRFYTAPLCTPSRSAFLTGKYPHHIGMQHSVIFNDEPFGLGLDQKLMPQYFKEAGYKTHLVGKWHLGFYQKSYWPISRGFDSFFGYLGPWIDYFDYTLKMFDRPYSRGYDLRRDFDVDKSYEHEYATDMFTKEAINLIENHDKKKPLFLLMTHLAPHSGNDDHPLQAKQEDYEKFSYIENEQRRTLAAMVYALDRSVGDVVESLTKTGMMEDTIIVFYSDNGGPTAFAPIHPTTASNFPLKGQKASAWEGGIRTDAIIYAPFLPSGVIRQNLFHVSDFLPTLTKLANATTKFTDKIDGMDLSNMIINGTDPLRKEVVVIDDVFGVSSIIHNNFKLVNGTLLDGYADAWLGSNDNSEANKLLYVNNVLRSKTAKSLKKFNKNVHATHVERSRSKAKVKCTGIKNECNLLKAPCLFDVINDPCEENNLADTNPSMMEFMTEIFEERLKNVVPSRFQESDPRCDPLNFDFTWDLWEVDSSFLKTEKGYRLFSGNLFKILYITLGIISIFRLVKNVRLNGKKLKK